MWLRRWETLGHPEPAQPLAALETEVSHVWFALERSRSPASDKAAMEAKRPSGGVGTCLLGFCPATWGGGRGGGLGKAQLLTDT